MFKFLSNIMSKKNLFVLLFAVIFISLVGFLLLGVNNKRDQVVYEDTLTISKEYLGLRYKTDTVLANAKDYENYDAWTTEVKSIIQEWETLEAKELTLEENASKISEETTELNMFSKTEQ